MMKASVFQKELQRKKIDAALFFSFGLQPDPNVMYFSGYDGSGVLVVPKKGDLFIIVPRMEYEKRIGVKKYVAENLFDKLRGLLGKNVRRIGVDYNKIQVSLLSRLKKELKASFKDISKVVAEQRLVKGKEEIEKIKKACSVTDAVFAKLVKNFRFRTEMDVLCFIGKEIKKNGCDLAFEPIIASGKNSSLPHYKTSDKKLGKGFCVIDFGARYKGYCSDMSRTLYLGKPSRKDIVLYEKLRRIQEKIIEMARTRVKCSELDLFARKWIGNKYFIHGLGHGIGVEVHEMPKINNKSKERLKEGVVFTIEPGMYVKNKFGIRIEDTVLMTKEKAVSLTKSTKKLIIKENFIN
ncbi:aminopeptidase P family protein [Candidatus Woesearchaeota archaeon]|nr:MAG: aminopeptidase P family protein [Candidatus Woesearchaeota archaeon]